VGAAGEDARGCWARWVERKINDRNAMKNANVQTAFFA
jgi:hypothetical protein